MISPQANADKARYSHAGHDYHFVWAARRALRILGRRDGLCAISIEGASPLDLSRKPSGDGTLIIDLAEYYGDERPDHAELLKYIQLKYSTQAPDDPWSTAKLTENKDGKPFGVIGRFAQLFQEKIAAWGRERTCAILQMEFVTNRPISADVTEALSLLGTGGDPPPKKRSVHTAYRRLKQAIGLDRENLKAFAQRLVLRGREGSRYAAQRALEQETNVLLPASDISVAARLKEMVREMALPERASDPTIRETTVLNALGLTIPRELLPSPPRFEDFSGAIRREQEEEIAEAILAYDAGHILIHASGGVGKSVLANRLGLHMPDGSVAIMFDGFAGGSYRDPRDPRHRYDRGLVQLVNEVATRGLCEPLIQQSGTSADSYLHAFDRKVRQAVSALRSTHPNAVLLIVLDAVDNSQRAANDAGHEQDCFPRGLLTGEAIEGCRIVALCRTERRDLLSVPESVKQIELRAFSVNETELLVRSRFAEATEAQIREFRRLTSANPRVQANELAAGGPSMAEVLQRLGPNPKTVSDAINEQLQKSLEAIREHGADAAVVDQLCTALAVLPPRVPLSVLNEACGVSKEQVRSFAADFGRPLWLQDDAIQFRDEPTDTWFRETFGNRKEIIAEICRALEVGSSDRAYALSALPRLLYVTERDNDLLALALDTSTIAGLTEFEQRRIFLQRVEFGLKSALRADGWGDIVRLLLLAGEHVSGSNRRERFIAENADIFSALSDPLVVQDTVLRRPVRSWSGRAHARSAALLSMHPEFSNEAQSFLRQAGLWLHDWMRQSKAYRGEHPIDENDIVNLVVAILNLHGAGAAASDLSSWRPKELSFKIARRVARRLIQNGEKERLHALFFAGQRNLLLRLGILAATAADQLTMPKKALLGTQKLLLQAIAKGTLKPLKNDALEWSGSLCLAEGLARAGARKAALAILEALPVTIPNYPPHPPYGGGNDERDVILRHRCLLAALKRSHVALEDLLPEKIRERLRPANADHDSDLRAFQAIYGALLGLYQLRADVIAGRVQGSDVPAALAEVTGPGRGKEWEWRHDWRLHDLPRLILRAWLDVLLLSGRATSESMTQLKQWIAAFGSLSIPTWTELAELASHAPGVHADCLDFAQKAAEMMSASHFDANSAADSYLGLAQAVQPASRDDAKAYLRLAEESLGGLGDESSNRFSALQTLVGRSCAYDSYRPETAYRYARVVEVIGREYASDKFPWHTAADAIARICPSSALAVLGRWRDRGTASFWRTLPSVVTELLIRRMVTPAQAAALRVMGGKFEEWPAERMARGLFSALATAEARKPYGRILIQDFDFDSGYNRQASQMAAVFDEFGVDASYLRLRIKREPELIPSASGVLPVMRREERAPQLPDWQAITDGLDLTRPEGIALAVERFRACDPPLDWETFYAELRKRVPVGARSSHVRALFACPNLEAFLLVEAIESAVAEWQASPAVSAELPGLVAGYARHIAPSLVFNREWWGVVSDAKKIASLSPGAKISMAEALVRVAADQLDRCDADTVFSIAEVCADVTEPSAAFDALEFAIGRFDTILKAGDGDGPWHDGLKPPEGLTASIGGLIHAGLAVARTSERWRAAHAVLRLCRCSDVETLNVLCDRVLAGDGTPFTDATLPFYDYHARVYLLMALARAALDVPGTVAAVLDLLKRAAFDPTPHILVRKHAQDALLAIERGVPGSLTDQERDRIASFMNSPFPTISEEESPRRRSNDAGQRSRVSEEFHFSYDFDRYWFDTPSEMFGVNAVEFQERALKWVKQLRGSWMSVSGRWDEDPRHKRGIYRDRDTWHSHSSYPQEDDLSFYLSYHAMFCTVGELLAERPMVTPRFEWDGLDGWMRTHHLPARKDGLWLVDRRDLAMPKQMKGLDQTSGEAWTACIQAEDFALLLYEHAEPGALNVKGYWRRSDGSRKETIHVNSALVTSATGPALIRALQTARTSHDFYIPSAQPRQEIRKVGFRLTGWVKERERQSSLDNFDPLAGAIYYPEPRPSRAIERLLRLVPHDDCRWWSVRESTGEPVMWSKVWGDWETSRGQEGTDFGERLSARLSFVLDVLKRVRRDLLIVVTIERTVGTSNEYRRENIYWKVYGLRADGSLYKL